MTNLTRSFMNKPLTYLFLLLSMLGIALPAAAELELTGKYYGIQFTNGDYELDIDNPVATDFKESWNFIDAKYGSQLNDLVSVEGRLGVSNNLGKDHGIVTLGGYLRIGKNLGRYRPYGLIGGSGIFIYEEGLDDYDESSFSYGAGIEIFGSPNVALTFEWLRGIDKSVDDGDLTFDSVGFGFNYYFSEESSIFNKNRNKIRSIRY